MSLQLEMAGDFSGFVSCFAECLSSLTHRSERHLKLKKHGGFVRLYRSTTDAI